MTVKSPASSPPKSEPGPVSRAISKAEAKVGAAGNQITPDGFPGPTTIMFVTAKSDSGAMAKHIIDLINMAKKSGIRVVVASPSNPPYGFEFKKLADKFLMIPPRKFSFGTLFYLRKQIKKYKVNIVHSHGRAAGVYSRLLGRMTKASIVHSPHGIAGDGGARGKLKLLIEKALADFKYDAVFSSQNERMKALEVGTLKKSTEAYVIDNAIDLTKYPVRKNAAIALSKVDFAKPETYWNIRIGASLRPESPRGIGTFLKLVKDAASCGKFTCIGMTRQQLTQFGTIPSNLEILGPVPDATAWLYSLDIFVSTSTSEGQVVGANEAIAAGAICMLSKISPHEAFAKHHAALLFDTKSSQDFISVLNTLVCDRSLRDMLLGNSRYMLERFNDAESFRVSFMDVYRSSVKRAAGLIL